jgi:hypothetical protein
LFNRVRAFIRTAKTGIPFAIYATPTSGETITSTNIRNFKTYFEKKMQTSYVSTNCTIVPLIQDEAQPSFGPIYNQTQFELSALKDYIEENLAKSFIRYSRSLAGAPIPLLLCVDYCGLNKITVKNHYPLPLIFGLLDLLGQAKIYTKINL